MLFRSPIDRGAQRVLALVDGDLSDDEHLQRTVTAVREHEATEATRHLAREWSDQAVAAIAGLPDGEVKQALVDFARAVADRAA